MKDVHTTPNISIGVPVYNGERFLHQRLDSILKQSFKNFELIISDNASTDSTQKICKEFLHKDSRIRYFRQEKNIGIVNNFNFLLENAKCPYFVWAAVDDKWDDTFIEKNVKILDSNPNVVASTGIVEFFGGKYQNSASQSSVKKLKNLVRSIDIKSKRYEHVHPISGTYEYKAQFYLRFNQASFVYGVFRTEDLRKKLIHGPIYGWDLVVLLNILRCGDFFVVDEVLFEKFDGGLSSKGVLEEYRRGEFTFWDLILPTSSFALWCKRNIGLKFYIKNLNWFILLTLYGWRTILLEIVKNSSFMKNVKNS